MSETTSQKTVIVGAGPVGALAALYAAQRGHDVEVYELRSGTSYFLYSYMLLCITILDHKSLQIEERTSSLALISISKLRQVAGARQDDSVQLFDETAKPFLSWLSHYMLYSI